MRYKYANFKPIIKYNGEHITKDDINYLYRGIEKNSFAVIADLFDVDPVDVFIFAVNNGINYRVEDQGLYKLAMQRDEAKNKIRRAKLQKEWDLKKKEKEAGLWKQAEDMYGRKKPEPIEHKIGNTGKVFVDMDAVKIYRKGVQNIFNQLNSKRQFRKKDINTIRCVELSAMRLHRGLDMYKFSEVSGLSYKQVYYYEKTNGVYVPKEISDLYRKVLNISAKELKKIIECLSGTRKSMFEEDRREIPDSVREYVWKRDKGKCQRCSNKKYLHFHHVERFSDGGKHEAKNIKLLCVSCHAEEHKGEKGYHLLKSQVEKLLGVSV